MNIYAQTDTIAAIATPLGTGGVAIVRISGDKSSDIVSKIFKGKDQCFKPNMVHYGWVYDDQNLIDEVVLLYFKAPHSFTGDDVFEIQCHGGINIVKKILKLCLNNGARLAEKGEFSKRAFINGKMDLSKAETVLDMIHARTDKFAQSSAINLSGKLAQKINALRSEVLNLLSLITAAVDFPEDVDEPEYSFITEKVTALITEIDKILKGSRTSNLMREGIKIAIAGKPNAGKSSLFNALLDIDRAIVTDIPGTTRDIIQESIDIDGIPAVLIDTAGLREAENKIESIGISLTKEAVKDADILLCVFDLSLGETEDYPELENNNIIKVGSKVDLVADNNIPKCIIAVSSKEKIGLDTLKQKIRKIALGNNQDCAVDEEFCTNIRQQECLKNSKYHLEKTLEGCHQEVPQDLLSIDLKSALLCLGEITGEVVSEEILDNIFSNFCIGK